MSVPDPVDLDSEVYRYTVPEGNARRMAWTMTRATVGRTRNLVLYTVLTLASLGLGAVGALPFGALWWVFPTGFVAIIVLTVLLTFGAMARHVDASLSVGSEVWVQYGPETFREVAPQADSTIRYDTYSRMWRQDGFVLFRARRGALANILHDELMPPEWFDYIRTRLSER